MQRVGVHFPIFRSLFFDAFYLLTSILRSDMANKQINQNLEIRSSCCCFNSFNWNFILELAQIHSYFRMIISDTGTWGRGMLYCLTLFPPFSSGPSKFFHLPTSLNSSQPYRPSQSYQTRKNDWTIEQIGHFLENIH